MHSIVLTSTVAALNDPSYMYAALWAHNFLLYPYKMYFHTFLCVKLHELSRMARNLDDSAKWSSIVWCLGALLVHGPVTIPDEPFLPLGISRDRFSNQFKVTKHIQIYFKTCQKSVFGLLVKKIISFIAARDLQNNDAPMLYTHTQTHNHTSTHTHIHKHIYIGLYIVLLQFEKNRL